MGGNDPNIGRMERRSFLNLSAGLIAAITFGGVPELGRAGETQFSEARCGGDKNMGKRVLITYASKNGSTGGVADALGKELCGKGLAADVALARNAGDLKQVVGALVVLIGV